MILITGATGRVGGATLKQLSTRGVPVRALVRNAEKAALVAGPSVETVIGDLAQPRSLESALDGITAALLVSPLDPHQVELQGNFIDAAKRAGRVHVVKISGLGTALDSSVRSGRWHAQTEKHLEDSGLPFTHLRPPFFMQNILRFAPTIRASGEFTGSLDQGKVAMIDVDDIAAVAATALTTDCPCGQGLCPDGARSAFLCGRCREAIADLGQDRHLQRRALGSHAGTATRLGHARMACRRAGRLQHRPQCRPRLNRHQHG